MCCVYCVQARTCVIFLCILNRNCDNFSKPVFLVLYFKLLLWLLYQMSLYLCISNCNCSSFNKRVFYLLYFKLQQWHFSKHASILVFLFAIVEALLTCYYLGILLFAVVAALENMFPAWHFVCSCDSFSKYVSILALLFLQLWQL